MSLSLRNFSPTHIKKVILPNIVKLFAAKLGEFYQSLVDFCAEHSTAVRRHVVFAFFIDESERDIRFARVF